MLSRRRFLTIAAAATALPGTAHALPLTRWRGVALGADASITLAHPRAGALIAEALAEVARLERIFSLHDPESELARLNAAGLLERPTFDFLECLTLAGAVHRATGGLFDPTIQPLWALHAQHHARGQTPTPEAVAAARARTGWEGLRFAPDGITLRPGMALSLNGIAQGFIADKVADLLRSRGLTDVLVNTGEMRALGGHPQGGGWPVTLDDGQVLHRDALQLENIALASSSPHAITFDAAGQASHILNPLNGLPAPARWRLVSVVAPRAGVADALSTAFCLMEHPAIEATLAAFPGARLAHLG